MNKMQEAQSLMLTPRARESEKNGEISPNSRKLPPKIGENANHAAPNQAKSDANGAPERAGTVGRQIVARLRARAAEIARKKQAQSRAESDRPPREFGGMPYAELPLTALHGEGKYPPPRRDFDDAGILALADSIRLHGLLQPLLVRPLDGYTLPGDARDGAKEKTAAQAAGASEPLYTVICGLRRLRALEILGRKTAPCFVCLLPEEEAALLSLCENLHRRPLHLFEQAAAEKALLSYATPEELSALLSLPASSVESRLPLDKLTAREKLLIRAAELPEEAVAALCRSDDGRPRMAVLEQLCRLRLTERGGHSAESLMAVCTASAKLEQGRRLLLQKDRRLFFNSIERAVQLLRDAGVDVSYTARRENGAQTILITYPLP